MPTLSASDRIGTLLEGKYRLDRILGEGGMGVVLAGEHIRLKRPVAVKFLHPHVAQHAEARYRFVREAESAAALKHPNVVDVFDVGETPDGSAYMVLEFLRGDSLADFLASRTRLSEADTAEFMVPVLRAVGYAHENGIVHRDLKPDNIFLSQGPSGTVIPKVLDFGIAKLLESDGQHATQTGSVMGTPLYMSPEQAHGSKALAAPADVWSLGVILFECLTGRLPWEFAAAPTLPAILVTIATQPPAPIATIDPHITPALAAVVDHCLRTDPSLRYANATEVASALEAIRPSLRAVLSDGHAHAITAQGHASVDFAHLDTQAPFDVGPVGRDVQPPPVTQLAPPVAAHVEVPVATASTAPKIGATTAELAHAMGLSSTSPPSAASSITSISRALWAIAAIAAISFIGVGLMLTFRATQGSTSPVVATEAMPASAAVPVIPVGALNPSSTPPVVSASPTSLPSTAVPSYEPVPSSTPPSATTDSPRVRSRPPPIEATNTTTTTTTAAPPSTMTTTAMRLCANGVCSDIGGF